MKNISKQGLITFKTFYVFCLFGFLSREWGCIGLQSPDEMTTSSKKTQDVNIQN